MTSGLFGNLSFSSYTMETQAERCVLAIQAALKVAGYAQTHLTMKKVLRLKRSMSRNKTHRYSFNLIQAKPKEVTKTVTEVTNDRAELLTPLLESVTGLTLRSKEAKITSSGHFLVKFVLAGKQASCRVEPGTCSAISANKAREEVATLVFKDLLKEFPCFSIQPFRIRMDKGLVGLSVQCVYRGANAAS